MLTAEDLKKALKYDPTTGVFYWLKGHNKVQIGDVAGSIDIGGYRRIKIFRRRYMAHRLAWLYVHGAWPENLIDHINGDRDDNRLSNLRAATKFQNSRNKSPHKNSTTRLKGVVFVSASGNYRAQIRANGKTKYLGYFDHAMDAHKAYQRAALVLHEDFANWDERRPARAGGMERGVTFGLRNTQR